MTKAVIDIRALPMEKRASLSLLFKFLDREFRRADSDKENLIDWLYSEYDIELFSETVIGGWSVVRIPTEHLSWLTLKTGLNLGKMSAAASLHDEQE